MRRTLFGFSWLVAASGLVLAGCGGLGINRFLPPGSTTNNNDPIVGTWKTTQMQVGTVTTACPGTITTSTGNFSCEAEVRTYATGNAWTTSAPSDLVAAGTYSITGTILSVTNPGANTTVSGTIAFSGDLNTFTWSINGATFTNARQ